MWHVTKCGILLETQRGLSVSICESAGHSHQLCWNSWANRGAVWDVDSGGTKEPCIEREPGYPRGKEFGASSAYCKYREYKAAINISTLFGRCQESSDAAYSTAASCRQRRSSVERACVCVCRLWVRRQRVVVRRHDRGLRVLRPAQTSHLLRHLPPPPLIR